MCEEPVNVVKSSDYNKDTTGSNVLHDCNVDASYWRSHIGKTGSEAELIMDIGCLIRLEQISLRNGFGDFGTKQYSVWGARSVTSSWVSLHNGTLGKGGEAVRWK